MKNISAVHLLTLLALSLTLVACEPEMDIVPEESVPSQGGIAIEDKENILRQSDPYLYDRAIHGELGTCKIEFAAGTDTLMSLNLNKYRVMKHIKTGYFLPVDLTNGAGIIPVQDIVASLRDAIQKNECVDPSAFKEKTPTQLMVGARTNKLGSCTVVNYKDSGNVFQVKVASAFMKVSANNEVKVTSPSDTDSMVTLDQAALNLKTIVNKDLCN